MIAFQAFADGALMGGAASGLFEEGSPEAGARRIVDYLIAVGLPLVVLVAAAIALPGVLGRRLPETMSGLALNLVLCAVLLSLLSAALLSLSALAHGGAPTGGWSLIPILTLVWGPIVVVILMQHPQRWRPDL
ncbi:MAG: hypothetical protein ACU0CI_09215 [Shimia sp.]